MKKDLTVRQDTLLTSLDVDLDVFTWFLELVIPISSHWQSMTCEGMKESIHNLAKKEVESKQDDLTLGKLKLSRFKWKWEKIRLQNWSHFYQIVILQTLPVVCIFLLFFGKQKLWSGLCDSGKEKIIKKVYKRLRAHQNHFHSQLMANQ